MHEMALTEGVVRIVEEQAGTHRFSKVRVVRLEIGELSAVNPDSMAFCFEAVASGSPVLEGAVLEIVRVPGEAVCRDCGGKVAIANRFDACPLCNGVRLSVTHGEEMRIKELEVA